MKQRRLKQMTIFFKILSILIFIGAIVIPIGINYKRSKDAIGYNGTYNKVKKRSLFQILY